MKQKKTIPLESFNQKYLKPKFRLKNLKLNKLIVSFSILAIILFLGLFGDSILGFVIGACNEGWTCDSPESRVYLVRNCKIKTKDFCQNGCYNGECIGPGNCKESWTCINEGRRAFQMSNCMYINQEYCPQGCNNGECNPEVCEEGWKCQTPEYSAYLTEDCKWTNPSVCQKGCIEGKCKV